MSVNGVNEIKEIFFFLFGMYYLIQPRNCSPHWRMSGVSISLLGLVYSAESGKVLEWQILGLGPRPIVSEILWVRPSNLCSSKPSRWFWGTLGFENHWSKCVRCHLLREEIHPTDSRLISPPYPQNKRGLTTWWGISPRNFKIRGGEIRTIGILAKLRKQESFSSLFLLLSSLPTHFPFGWW